MQCNRAYSVRKPNAMQHQMSMKTAASVFCSRIPKVMAMATAMTEALMLYSAQRLCFEIKNPFVLCAKNNTNYVDVESSAPPREAVVKLPGKWRRQA